MMDAPLPTPPLGFSTWQGYPGSHWGTKGGQYNSVTEEWCRAQVEALSSKGLVNAGYTVFIVDEPCFAGRDNATGALVPNSTTWPNGFKPFAAYLKSKGMELGIYTDAGPFTCQGCPASAGNEALDVQTFLDWGARYIKVDRCFGVDSETMREDLPETFAKYRAAAAAHLPSERVQISAILAATDSCWEWCSKNGTCDHCRTTGDIHNSLGAMAGHVNEQSAIPYIASFAHGSGYYNDLDMLLLGNLSLPNYPGGLTMTQKRAMMALWAMLKSPMLISSDATTLSHAEVALLTSKGMLAVLNDALGYQALRLRTSAGVAPNAQGALSFTSCAPPGTSEPLARQQWSVDAAKGTIAPLHNPSNRVLSYECGSGGARGGPLRASLCAASASERAHDGYNGCRNVSCVAAGAVRWTIDFDTTPLIVSALDGSCLQGVLGPQSSKLSSKKCDPSDPQQRWALHADGTLRAFDRCLTAELTLEQPSPSAADVFAVELSGGRCAVLFWNQANAAISSASLKLAELPVGCGGVKSVTDVWSGAKEGTISSGVLGVGPIAPTGSIFVFVE